MSFYDRGRHVIAITILATIADLGQSSRKSSLDRFLLESILSTATLKFTNLMIMDNKLPPVGQRNSKQARFPGKGYLTLPRSALWSQEQWLAVGTWSGFHFLLQESIAIFRPNYSPVLQPEMRRDQTPAVHPHLQKGGLCAAAMAGSGPSP